MQPEEGRPRRFTRLLLEQVRADVVLLNNLAAFNGARYARVHAEVAPEVPVVAVVHEWRAIRSKEGEERGERYLRAAQAGLDSVSAVVFPSEHTRALGREELGLRYPERALVIPNPLQPAFADSKLSVDGPRRGVAFVGSFNERKNPARPAARPRPRRDGGDDAGTRSARGGAAPPGWRARDRRSRRVRPLRPPPQARQGRDRCDELGRARLPAVAQRVVRAGDDRGACRRRPGGGLRPDAGRDPGADGRRRRRAAGRSDAGQHRGRDRERPFPQVGPQRAPKGGPGRVLGRLRRAALRGASSGAGRAS